MMKKFSVEWMLDRVLLPCDMGCDTCFRPEDLRILDGELTCQTCFDDAFFHSEDAPDWWDLEELPDLASSVKII